MRAARLSFTLVVEGELTSAFERKEWNQPIGLHITALAGLALAVGLPLTSISTVCSAIFLIVFAVVSLRWKYRAGGGSLAWAPSGARRHFSYSSFAPRARIRSA